MAKKIVKKNKKAVKSVKKRAVAKKALIKKLPPAKKTVHPVKGKELNKKISKVERKGKVLVYLGLGSNVGDREEYIEQAVFLLEKNANIQVVKRSTNYETEPEGGGAQPLFINAAVIIRTKLSPHQLLEVLQEIEVALGRERDVEWGPRTMDIDILLYDGEVISDEKLQIPHPLMHERLFVLKPLREIAPNLMHPVLEKSIETLYEDRKAESGEKYDDELPGFKEIKGGGYDDYERW